MYSGSNPSNPVLPIASNDLTTEPFPVVRLAVGMNVRLTYGTTAVSTPDAGLTELSDAVALTEHE